VYLQLWRYQDLNAQAESNRTAIVPIVPNRGVIMDRNGIVLATNYSAYTLEITPSKVVEPLDEVIEKLSELIDIQGRDKRRFRKLREESKSFESVPIRTRLSDEEVARFAAQRYRFPGVEIRARLFRNYPYNELASHVIGYIGRINQSEKEKLEEQENVGNYRGTDYIGKLGVEQSYERQLHGQTGVHEMETSAGGRAVRRLRSSPATPGNTVALAIDIKLQQLVEDMYGGRRGALVAIDPSNGEILAFVSKPGFDPNLFVDNIDPQSWTELNTSINKPLLNRALAGTYPPGSTFKPFMALAGLFYGKRTPQQAISDPGYFMFGGHRFRDDKEGGHGAVNLFQSLVVSCDTYYYMLANDLGIDAIANFMTLFGFGSKTGIDLKGEASGILPSSEWKQRRFKQKWFPGETISVGIGQGYNSYTPLQLAVATATLANNGIAFKPHIVNHVENIQTKAKTVIEPSPTRDLQLKPEHLEAVKQAMIAVNKEGTGSRAFIDAPYSSAGKTGTAQVIAIKQDSKYIESQVAERHRDHALFIAYAPTEKPKIALAVIVENAGFGARAAAPIARLVLDYYLLGKLPKQPATDE
jgi:penicillin-binding protein 2